MDDKQIAKHKIQKLVHLHALHIHHLCGLEVDKHAEEKRIYADWQAGLVTLEEIEEDTKEYLCMRQSQ